MNIAIRLIRNMNRNLAAVAMPSVRKELQKCLKCPNHAPPVKVDRKRNVKRKVVR